METNLNIEFIEWLHELTELGYEKDIIISAKHADKVRQFYKGGFTPAEALEAYIRDIYHNQE